MQHPRRVGAAGLSIFLSLLVFYPLRMVFSEKIPAYHRLQEGEVVYPSAHVELESLLELHLGVMYWSLLSSTLLVILAFALAVRGKRAGLWAKAAYLSCAAASLGTLYLWGRYLFL